MTKDLVKVTALPTKITIGSDTYPPFRASKDRAYTEVPSGLAVALSLPFYSEAEPEPATEPAKEPAPTEDTRNVAQLTEALAKAEISIPSGSKKDDLLKLAAENKV